MGGLADIGCQGRLSVVEPLLSLGFAELVEFSEVMDGCNKFQPLLLCQCYLLRYGHDFFHLVEGGGERPVEFQFMIPHNWERYADVFGSGLGGAMRYLLSRCSGLSWRSEGPGRLLLCWGRTVGGGCVAFS